MRILFLTRSFNGLAQRLYLELSALGHEVSVEFDIADAVTLEAVAAYQPALVIAPFLRRAIPPAVWQHTPCLVVHPGIVGDRGPSALDWAISEGVSQWGVTVLQAVAELDAGPVWAHAGFPMRAASKSSLYRNEVTEAAVRAVRQAVQAFERAGNAPPALEAPGPGRWRPLMPQQLRRIDWRADPTATVLRKIRAADGAPGVLDELFGIACHLFDAHAEPLTPAQAPGRVIARRHDAVLRSTVDGAVWIGHVRRADVPDTFKLPTARAFPSQVQGLPDWSAHGRGHHGSHGGHGGHEIRYEAAGEVGILHFAFYNGALSTAQCQRLQQALQRALDEPTRVLLLMGGEDFWCNGIHLNVIEAADSPADESWRNINAIDDLCCTLIEATSRLVISAMQGSAGAGGVFLALAADQVWARPAVVLNPHYKNMGNLYGSEYWTYLLPRRPLKAAPQAIMNHRLPVSAAQALELGLIDEVFGDTREAFVAQALAQAQALAAHPGLPGLIQEKQRRRLRDEAERPLASYREQELGQMRRNFYGFDPSYHMARSNFVRRVAPSWTPRHLARHRGAGAAAAAVAGGGSVDEDQA